MCFIKHDKSNVDSEKRVHAHCRQRAFWGQYECSGFGCNLTIDFIDAALCDDPRARQETSQAVCGLIYERNRGYQEHNVLVAKDRRCNLQLRDMSLIHI